MECLHRRLSYASWRLQVFRSLLDSSTNSNVSKIPTYRGFSTSSDPPRPQEQSTSNATSKPRPSELLPRSPIAVQQTLQKKRKRPPTAEDLHDLSRNPWAMALASPLRMCAITRTRLPRDLLCDWGMIQRPDDPGKLWIMPVGLLKDELAVSVQQEHNTAGAMVDNNLPQNARTSRSLNYLRLRLLNRLPLLRKLTRPLSRATGGKRSAVARIIPQRWKPPFGPITTQEERQMVWRHDMPDFVLGHTRKEVMKRLKIASSEYQAEWDTASRVWSVIELGSGEELSETLGRIEDVEHMGRGAVLVTGSMSSLPEYVTLPQTQTRVPVLDLSVLLSESDLESLKAHDARFQSSALFFRPNDPLTADALLALWKLQGLLRHDEQA